MPLIQSGKTYSSGKNYSVLTGEPYLVNFVETIHTMYSKKKPEDLDCGIEVAAKVFGGKWKPCILDSIRRGNNRPSQIHRSISSATPRVLNMQLKELENYKIVRKKIYPGLPPRVDYYLTPLGESILPIVVLMDRWGMENKEGVKRVNETLKVLDSIS